MSAPDPTRVAELFDALADLPPAEASRRLAEDLRDEPELRRRVERLLENDRAAGEGFFQPPAELLALALREHSPPDEAATAARVGRFSLVRKLGEGGMGVVYLGYDEQLDRRVAIKLLRHGAAGAERLLREAQALAKLSHPNVVPLYEVGEQDGRVFLAMELVDGPTLRAFLSEAPKPAEDVLRVFVQAGRGLAAAHAEGIVHRDFKPDNVLLGKDGRPRVVDFGIAGMAGSSALDAGAILGTPAFMSPEQIRGERVTPASDQFSFCVALYKAVHGAAPFAGEGLLELFRSVSEGALRPAPRGSTAPAWLWPILARGLSPRPEDRFPTLAALLDAIEAHLPRDPELDPATTRRERWILGLVLLALALGITGFLLARGMEAEIQTPWDLVNLAALIFAVSAAAVAVLWRRLARNLAGKRFAYAFLLGFALLLAGRLVGAFVGLSVRQVLTMDILHLSIAFAFAALTIERWFISMAALGVAALGVAVLKPSWAMLSFAVYAPFTAALSVFLWARTPGAGR